MKVKYEDRLKQKVIAITTDTLVVGVDIAKNYQWARFDNPRQMSRMAGYNLVEDSSGKNKSGTKISKRGRKNLRSVLYQMSLTMVATYDEMKQLYQYLKTREKDPLRKM